MTASFNDRQRAIGIADILQRAAAMSLHGGDTLAIKAMMSCANTILDRDKPETYYGHALDWAGCSAAEIAIAVAAILDGKHPPESAIGRVARFGDKASRERDATHDHDRMMYCDGQAHACRQVLTMLGFTVETGEKR